MKFGNILSPMCHTLERGGCLAYDVYPDPKRSKFESGAYECIFIRYVINSKAYHFYDLKNQVIIESK